VDNLPTLIKEADTILYPPRSCTQCGYHINRNNLSGLCRKCRSRKNNYSQGRRCSECDKPITNRSRLGLCRACSQIARKYSYTRECEGGCGNCIVAWNVSVYCKECMKTHYIEQDPSKYTYYKAWRSTKKEHKQRQRTDEMGKCRKCTQEFQLEAWQHSTMHWCPECRKGEDYQHFFSHEHKAHVSGLY